MDFETAYDIIVDKIEDWAKDFVSILPNLVIALLILVAGIFTARFLKNVFFKAAIKIFKHKNLANLITNIFYILLVAITIFAALSILKLDKTVTTLLAGAGVIGLALAFAFQDIASNFVSGVFIAVNRPFKAGEMIKSKDHTGIVEIVNLRDTVIKTFQGQIVRIPNKEIFQNPLVNYTQSGRRRLDLAVGVSYNDDLEKVEQVALDAIKNISVISKKDEPKIFFKDFGESSINIEIFIWLISGEQSVYLQGRSESIKLIKEAFEKNGISIPFPIRTLDFAGNDARISITKAQQNKTDE